MHFIPFLVSAPADAAADAVRVVQVSVARNAATEALRILAATISSS